MPSYLNSVQNVRAKKLSRMIREAVRNADFERASIIFQDYHSLLHPFGKKSENRLLKAKLWVWEAAVEAGEFTKARRGLKSILNRLNDDTRGYLETLKLLSVLEIRCENLEESAKYAKELTSNVEAIRTERTRKEFHEDFIERLKQELVITLLRENSPQRIEPVILESEAGRLVQMNLTANDLIAKMGAAIPEDAKRLLLRVESEVRGNLPYYSAPLLPPPEEHEANLSYGAIVRDSLGRIVYPLICRRDTEVQRTCAKVGIAGLFGAGSVLAKSFSAAFFGMGCSLVDVAAPMMAVVVNEKLDSFCKSASKRTIL